MAEQSDELTPEMLGSLQPGDQVEVDPLFPGMSGERVRLDVVERRDDGQVDVIARWHGITLGRWSARVEDGRVAWQV